MHSLLQAGGEQEDHVIIEQRLFKEVLGKKFSGQLDHYSIKDKVLTDWKFVSCWSVMHDVKEEYIAQSNLLKYLLKEAGHEVETAQLVCIIRDWSKREARLNKNYPQAQVQIIKLPIWSDEECKEFLEHKVSELLKYEDTPDDEIPVCNSKQRWTQGESWKVKKKGGKRAVNGGVHFSELEAKIHASQIKGEVSYHAGEDKRCLDHCKCKHYCSYWQSNYGEKDEPSNS